MDVKRTCPNCEKPIPADRAYCMHCGVSVGIKCPACGTVSPLGSKRCSACGGAFEAAREKKKKPKKKTKHSALAGFWKRYANVILPAGVILFLLTGMVLALTTPLTIAVSEDHPRFPATVSIRAFDLITSFFGGTAESVSALETFVASMTTEDFLLHFLLDADAVCYLLLFVLFLPMLLLAAGNLLTCGKATAMRLLRMGSAFGGICLLQFVCSRAIGAYLSGVLAHSRDGELFSLRIGGTAIALMIVGVLCTAYVLLYALLYFRKNVALEGEHSLSDLLFRNPLIQTIRARRRGRVRNRGRACEEKEAVLCVTKRFSLYLVLLVAALIFTQALANVASYICFLFLLFMPLVLLLYVLTAKSALTVHMISDSCTVEKGQPSTYEFCINNHFIFAYPFVEAKISLPQTNSVRCAERTVYVAISPLAQYRMKNTVTFRFRGTYEIGVRCFYVYDFFRLFRIRVDVNNMEAVSVMPRKLQIAPESVEAVADSAAHTVKSPVTYDKLEVSDIREYRSGDALKSIHWKLSSKSEEFIVREYNTGTANMTVVFCDFAARCPSAAPAAVRIDDHQERKTKKHTKAKKRTDVKVVETAQADAAKGEAASQMQADAQALADRRYYEDMNEFLADGVVELTVATVLHELREGRIVTLCWFDRRSDAGVCACVLSCPEDFDLIFREFATAPLCQPEESLSRLCAMIGDGESTKQIFVTGAVDRGAISDLCRIPGLSEGAGFGAAEVLLYHPEERYANRTARALYLEACREQLAENGLSLQVVQLPFHTDDPVTDRGAVLHGEEEPAHG